jgi:uncharacterized protein (TIGR02145 family)
MLSAFLPFRLSGFPPILSRNDATTLSFTTRNSQLTIHNFIDFIYLRIAKLTPMKPQKISAFLFITFCLGIPILLHGQSVTDFDGNTYPTVKIGTQTWMGQNLNVSRFRNGDPIMEAKSDETWEKASEEKKPAWCYYDFSADQGKVYGKLYNWYAVNDPRGLAPKGWHVPSEEEWNMLSGFLGGEEKAGGKLKENGITHWKTPNSGATNESGFAAMPSGLIYSFGGCVKMGIEGYWWTSKADGDETAILYSMSYQNATLTNLFLNKGVGIAVRCVKD